MTIKVRVAGVMKTVDKISVKVGGVVKEVERIRLIQTINDLRGLRTAYVKGGAIPPVNPPPQPPPADPDPVVLNVAFDKPAVSGSLVDMFGTVTTQSIKASVSNGYAPFTYQWTIVSWTSVTPPTITTPTVSETTFKCGLADLPQTETAVFKCTVTDQYGNIGSKTVNATFITRERFIGGDYR